MSDQPTATFDLVFFGETLPGADQQKVRNNAAKLFRASEAQLESLFSGKPVVLKSNLDRTTAESFQQKLKAAGLICQLREKLTETSPAPKQTDAPAAASATGWSIAPVGADVLTETAPAPPPMPDTSTLSLKEQTGYLFEQDDTPPPPPPDISHITLE